MKQSFKDLLISLMFLFIAVCTFASIVCFAESRDEFESIPTGWWLALVTLTTVGYGDVYPKTWIGRAVGSVCALNGVVLIALSLPILVDNFLLSISMLWSITSPKARSSEYKSNRKAMDRNCNNRKENPALKTKTGNK